MRRTGCWRLAAPTNGRCRSGTRPKCVIDPSLHRVVANGVLLGRDRPLEEARRRRKDTLHRRRRQQLSSLGRNRQAKPLSRTPGRHPPQIAEELQRGRRPELVPAQRSLGEEPSEVPQVVGVGADRVRAVPGVGQMRQEPVDQPDLVAGIVEQQHPTDDAALTFLDHPHTGLPRRCSARSGSGAHVGDVGGPACRDNRELGDHGQHVEQQPTDRVGRVVHRAAEAEPDLPAVSSSAMARASGTERASRSSLVTTRVSPSRQAARASRSPGRSRLVPVRPWST